MPFCPQCGTSNPDGARFCQSCGTAVPTATSPPAAASAPPVYPPGYGQGAYPPQGAMAPVRRKSPGAAAALGLFWGFGAQAFYNGQPLKAVVQIVLNLLIMWPMLRFMGGGGAWTVGLAVAAVFMVDGYKVAQKINAGIPVGPWTSF
jgi:TM2 domain-containing membrane protein YozV